MLSAEQFAEWKTHPVTIEIFVELKKIKDSITDKLSNGNSLGSGASETHGLTNRMVGQIDGLNQLLNISYEDDAVIDEVEER